MKKAAYYLFVFVMLMVVARIAGRVLGGNPGYTGVIGALAVCIGAIVAFLLLGRAIDFVRSKARND